MRFQHFALLLATVSAAVGCGGGETELESDLGIRDAGMDAGATPCTAGTFSVTGTAQPTCRPWTVCERGDVVTAAGTATSDRECSACPAGMSSGVPNSETCSPWAIQFGTDLNDADDYYGSMGQVDMAEGADGGLVVAGLTRGALDGASPVFGPTMYTRGLDAQGRETWTTQLREAADVFVIDVATTSDGTAFVACFVEVVLPDGSTGPAAVARFAPTGELDWIRSLDSDVIQFINGIDTTNDGHIVVSGSVPGSAAAILGAVAKYDAELVEQWSTTIGTDAHTTRAYPIAGAVDGRLVVAGRSDDDLTAGASTGANFVRMLDASGGPVWTHQFDSGGSDFIVAVTTAPDGSLYVAGRTDGDLDGSNAGADDAFVRRYTAAGVVDWTRQFGTTALELVRDIAVAPNGTTYVVGSTGGDLANPNAGVFDVFVRTLTPAGVTLDTMQFGTVERDYGVAVVTATDGNVYLLGTTMGSLDGPHQGDWDIFVRSIGP